MKIETIDILLGRLEAELTEKQKANVKPYQLKDIENNIAMLKKNRNYWASLPPVDVKAVLHRLKTLDLKTNPKDEVQDLLSKLLSVFPVMMMTYLSPVSPIYPISDSFVRARPYIKDGDPQITMPHELSFRPQKFNTNYQRASTPNKTMFYGCLKRLENEEIKIDNLFVASMEALQILRDKNTAGIRRIAFGKWQVIDEIRIVSILNHVDYHSKIPAIKKMYEGFKEYYKGLDMEEEAVLIADFISDRFADDKAGEGNEHLYIISAMFTEMILQRNPAVEGILYPSVRTIGEGVCVALKEEACNKLKLVVAGEYLLFKAKKQALMIPTMVTEVPNGASTFNMKHVKTDIKLTSCLKKIIVHPPKKKK